MMIIDERPRRSGKTMLLVTLMKKDKDGILVVPTERNRKLLTMEYKHLKNRCVTAFELSLNPNMISNKNIYIDEIGWCLSIILGNVVYGTHTNDKSPTEKLSEVINNGNE